MYDIRISYSPTSLTQMSTKQLADVVLECMNYRLNYRIVFSSGACKLHALIQEMLTSPHHSPQSNSNTHHTTTTLAKPRLAYCRSPPKSDNSHWVVLVEAPTTLEGLKESASGRWDSDNSMKSIFLDSSAIAYIACLKNNPKQRQTP